MTFTTLHIAVAAMITGLLAGLIGLWRLPRDQWQQVPVLALLTAAAVFLWRISANLPQLNDDGLPGFSANDWAAPILTYIFLSAYADLRPTADTNRYRQTRALTAAMCVIVNVLTI